LLSDIREITAVKQENNFPVSLQGSIVKLYLTYRQSEAVEGDREREREIWFLCTVFK
jgi:hypothetical protein